MPADKGWSRRFVDPIPPGWKTSGRHAIWLIRNLESIRGVLA
jgi:hypothetical protein